MKKDYFGKTMGFVIVILFILVIWVLIRARKDSKVEVPQVTTPGTSTTTTPGGSTTTTPRTNVPGITYNIKASGDLIYVTTPMPGDVTGKTFSILGKARGPWFFEGSFPVEILDKNGKSIASGPAKVDGGGNWMSNDFVAFKADITVPSSYIGAATIVLRKDNPSGLPENDGSISYPIVIQY